MLRARTRADPLSSRKNAAVIPFVSPESHEPLREEGGALSSESGKRYPIVDGIPRFVSPSSVAFTESFGLQWKLYSRTQLDSVTGRPLSRERLERCLGAPLASLAGRNVLEAGCGAGRFTELLVEAGAFTHAFDASVAVEVNAANVGKAANYAVAQADIMAIPYPPESFDVVLCLGVLQHTRSPEASIQALHRMVKPGGLLVIDHYRYSWTTYFRGSYVARQILKRLPPAFSLRIVNGLVKLFVPAHRWMRNKPRLLLKAFRRLSPVLDYFQKYPELSDEQQYEFSKLDTYDSLTDRFKHLRSVKQIAATLHGLGLQSVRVWSGGNGVEARGRKPV